MASRQVSKLWKLGIRVAAATGDQERNDKAMIGLIERCADVVPEGTTSLTVSEAQYYVGRQIEFETEKLRRGDDDHVKKLVGVDAQRQARNGAVTEVYGVLLRTRGAFEAVFGPGTSVKLLGLDTRVPDDPVRLYQTADRCRRWLRDPQIELPKVALPGFTFDRESMAAGIDGPLDLLGTALAVLPQEEKHSVDTLVSKLTGMKRLDELIGRGARWLEALYDIGGMEEESDRVRLSSHRSNSPAAPASPEAAPESAPAEGSPETVARTAVARTAALESASESPAAASSPESPAKATA